MLNNLHSFLNTKKKINKENEQLNNLVKNTKFDKKDINALIIAAMTTIMPVVIISCFLFYITLILMF